MELYSLNKIIIGLDITSPWLNTRHQDWYDYIFYENSLFFIYTPHRDGIWRLLQFAYICQVQAYSNAIILFKGITSTQRRIKAGAPQGSALSPMLYNLYTSDIPKGPRHTKTYIYADDIAKAAT